MSFCLSTHMDNLLGMNQTKYLIRPIIIVIITITRIKKKTRKWTPSLITNSLTYVFFSCGNNFFFQICSYFIKQNCLEWFEILKTLLMTWAVEEYCLEINVILIQQMNFRFSQWDLGEAGILYSGHLSVPCTFSWNHETNRLNCAVKIL